MATLVLTVVGGALGGPIGAALGAAVGQTIDREVLFKPKGREGPRLTDLAVQTSSYGRPIPKLFGTMRVAGSVIWATDLIETSERQGGGKGQPSVTTYNYAASFAVALSARGIVGVGRIWADGSLLRGAAGDWKTPTDFRLHLGGEDQPADPLIASAEGAGLTPAHRGIAYAVFEGLALADYGNRIPSLTFEVIADAVAVSVGAIAVAIGEGTIDGAAAALPLDGFSAYGDSVRGVAETLAGMSGAWFAPAGEGVAMRTIAPPAVSVTDDGGGAEPARRRRAIETVPKTITVAHYDPARDYQTGVQRARRPGAGSRVEAVEAPAVLSAGAAKTLAEAMLSRAEAARTTRRVTTDTGALGVAPGDAVTIVGEAGTWRVTEAALEAMAVRLDLLPLTPATLVTGASEGRVLPAPDLQAGMTILHAFETPALDDALLTRPRVTIVAAGTAPGWRRAALRHSLDGGISWVAAGGTAAGGVVGIVTVPPGVGPATLIDRHNAIEVELAHDAMALGDADAGALDRGANLALIGGELVQFARAVPIGGRQWRLTGLWRARRGMTAAHATGERFVLLNTGSAVAIELPAAAAGDAVAVMASGVGGATETATALSGASLLPPAPVRLTWRETDDGGAIVRWRRRSRVGWRWRDGADSPLGEEREAYRVTIAPTGGAARTNTVSIAETAVSAADRAVGSVAVTVRQIGTNGRSPAAAITF